MYELLGISLGLAALLTVNAVASFAGAGVWRVIRSPLQRCSARTRAEFLFAFRVAPLLLSTMFVAGFLIPAYLLHEPYGTNEVVSGKLATLAVISAIGVLLAVSRGVRSWLTAGSPSPAELVAGGHASQILAETERLMDSPAT